MFHINSLTTPTGEKGAIWGGLGNAVGPRAFGERLGAGGVYVVSAGDLGSLTIKDIGAGPNASWALSVNGSKQYLYMGEGQLTITVDAANVATISGGVGQLSVPLIREMSDTGPVTQQVIALVAAAPSLHKQWNADPMSVMYAAGFPRSSMLNLRQSIGGAPDCCTQFIAWLKTLQFSAGLEADGAVGGWLSCALCKGFIVGAAAAAFVAVAAACITAGPGGAAAAIAVLETSSAVTALAAAGGMTVGAVARMAATVFVSAGAAAFVGSIIDSMCQSVGACDGKAAALLQIGKAVA